MNRRAARSAAAPPLWIWPLAVALTLVVFAVTLDDYLDEAATRREVDQRAQLSRISAFARQRADRPDALHVIALGNSSLRNASYFDEEMEQYAHERGGPELHFLRIIVPGGTLHDFLGLLHPILDAAPDLLLVHSRLLPDRSNAKQRAWHRSYRAGGAPDYGVPRERHRTRLLTGRGTIEHQTWILDRVVGRVAGWLRIESGLGRRYEALRKQMFCNPGNRDRVLRLRQHQYPPEGEYAVDPSSATTVDFLVAQAARVGTTVVFIDIPVASPIASLPGMKRKAALQRGYFALHASEPAFDHWRFDQPVPDEHFCDWVHLSPRGRRSYASWLVERMREFAEERDAR